MDRQKLGVALNISGVDWGEMERWGFSCKTRRFPEVKYIILLFGVWKAQSKVLPFKES